MDLLGAFHSDYHDGALCFDGGLKNAVMEGEEFAVKTPCAFGIYTDRDFAAPYKICCGIDHCHRLPGARSVDSHKAAALDIFTEYRNIEVIGLGYESQI